MKVHMPLLMTIFAQVACSRYAPCTPADAPDSWFELPAGYEQRDLGDILADSLGVEGGSSTRGGGGAEATGEPGLYG